MLRLCLITTHGEENKWLGESLIPCSLDASEDSHSASIVAMLFHHHHYLSISYDITMDAAVCHHLHRDFGVTIRGLRKTRL